MRISNMQAAADQAIEFRDARNWGQFHNPKDLAISISLEAAELLEVFQWSGADTLVKEKRQELREELADILIYCLYLSDTLGEDPSQLILDKLSINEKKYPIEKTKNKSEKYTCL